MPLDLDKAVESFRRESREKEPIYPPAAACLRRTGLWVGALVGLAYYLSHVLRLINSPDVLDFPNALDLLGILLPSMVGGTLLGLVCAWPKSTLNGVAAASLVLTILPSLFFYPAVTEILQGSLALSEGALAFLAISVLGTLAVALLLSMPVAVLLRWTIASQCERPRRPGLMRRRILLLAAVLFLAAFVGGGLPI